MDGTSIVECSTQQDETASKDQADNEERSTEERSVSKEDLVAEKEMESISGEDLLSYAWQTSSGMVSCIQKASRLI